jgi:hypothetical protein
MMGTRRRAARDLACHTAAAVLCTGHHGLDDRRRRLCTRQLTSVRVSRPRRHRYKGPLRTYPRGTPCSPPPRLSPSLRRSGASSRRRGGPSPGRTRRPGRTNTSCGRRRTRRCWWRSRREAMTHRRPVSRSNEVGRVTLPSSVCWSTSRTSRAHGCACGPARRHSGDRAVRGPEIDAQRSNPLPRHRRRKSGHESGKSVLAHHTVLRPRIRKGLIPNGRRARPRRAHIDAATPNQPHPLAGLPHPLGASPMTFAVTQPDVECRS